MNTAEAAKIVGVLMGYYPDTFKDMSDEQTKVYIDIWQKSFADESYKTVSIAVWDFIQTSTDDFMPKIGKIKAIINEQRFESIPNEMEAFEILRKARSKYDVYAPISDKDEFETLSEPIKRAIGGRQGFINIGFLNTESETYSIEKTHFMKQYKAEIERSKKESARPTWLKKAIAQSVQNFEGIGNNDAKQLTD